MATAALADLVVLAVQAASAAKLQPHHQQVALAEQVVTVVAAQRVAPRATHRVMDHLASTATAAPAVLQATAEPELLGLLELCLSPRVEQAEPVEHRASLAQVALQAPAELVEQAVLLDPLVMAEMAEPVESDLMERRELMQLPVQSRQLAVTAELAEQADSVASLPVAAAVTVDLVDLADLADPVDPVLQSELMPLVPQAELPVLVAAQVREEARHLESPAMAAMAVTQALQEQAV